MLLYVEHCFTEHAMNTVEGNVEMLIYKMSASIKKTHFMALVRNFQMFFFRHFLFRSDHTRVIFSSSYSHFTTVSRKYLNQIRR